MVSVITASEEETFSLGVKLGKSLKKNSVVCFFGDLGSGKTTLIKGLVSGAIDFPVQEVTSPTFTYLNIYEGKLPVYHFDLYRLKNAEQFLNMGFEEMFESDGICCLEWAERIESILPEDAICIHLEHCQESSRKIVVKNYEKIHLCKF